MWAVDGFQFKPVIRRRDALLDAMLFTPVAIPSVRRGSERSADRPLANSDRCPPDEVTAQSLPRNGSFS